jgi:hypothetical protein
MKRKNTVHERTKARRLGATSSYDFSGGVRGKHYEAYHRGHTVRIRRADGTTLVQHFHLSEGAVILAPDVRKFFPDSKAVNKALRSLIALIPAKRSKSERA